MHRTAILSALFSAASLGAQGAAGLDWTLDPNPPSRQRAVLSYHAGLGATILFGGHHTVELGDTWLWSDGWRRVDSPTSPSPRSNASMAYDSLRGRIVLFGGREALNAPILFGDTWVFDGAVWTQLAPSASPTGRYEAWMTYDAARDRIVMHGGRFMSSVSLELWEFDGGNWALRPQSGAVPTQSGPLVHDVARAQTFLLGYPGGASWDGVQWTPRDTTGLPANHGEGLLFYDEVGQRVIYANPLGTSGRSPAIYASQGQGWTVVAMAPLVGSNRMALAQASAGRLLCRVSDSYFGTVPSDTLLLEGGQWRRILPGSPAGRANAGMAYDAGRERLVLHGGTQNVSRTGNPFEANGLNWRPVVLPSYSTDPLVARQATAYDSARGVTVTFGGFETATNQTSEWNGVAWTRLLPTVAPAARWESAMAFDAARSRILLHGGYTLVQTFGELWAWNGMTWTDISPATGPAPRRSHAISYDTMRDRVVLFGGTDGVTALADTWEFDGTAWIHCSPVYSPSPRSDHVQAYDTRRALTVVFGGTDGVTALADTWQWDGTDWSELLTPHRPDPTVGAGAAYDIGRGEFVFFGGVGDRGEVWRLRDVSLGAWQQAHQGCDGGYGPLTLRASGRLAFGRTSILELDHMAPHSAVLASAWVGFDDQTWSGTPLPVSLAMHGAPNCWVWADPAVPIWLAHLGTGTATGSLVIPDQSALLGVELFVQAVTWELGVDRISTANLLSGRIGAP